MTRTKDAPFQKNLASWIEQFGTFAIEMERFLTKMLFYYIFIITMSIDNPRSEDPERGSAKLTIDDQYYAETKEFDLLSREGETQLTARIQQGNKAYSGLVDRIRPCLIENLEDPTVKELLLSLRDQVPANFIELVQRSGEVQLSPAALDQGNGDAALLHTALDLTKQKEVVHLMMFGQRISKEETDDRVDVNQLGFRILRIISLIEDRCVPISKELAKPGLREIIETKEPVINHGQKARTQMRESNLRLVLYWAKHYQNRGLEYKDLVAEGNFGLMRAVEYFDHTRGFRFSTYATWWIKQCIERALANQAREVRLPIHVVETLSDFRKRVAQLEMHHNRKIGDDEAITIIGYENAEAGTLRQALRMDATSSLSYEYGRSTYGGNEARTLGEGLEDHRSPRPDEGMEQEELRDERERTFDVLKAVLSVMEQRGELQKWECEIIRLRLGLDDGQPKTYEEIGQIYGVTRERIRQLQDKALKKLETKMAIMQSERTASTEGKENRFATYGDVVETIEHRLRYVRSTPIMKIQRNKIEELLKAVLNNEEEKVVRLRIGMDGEAKSQDEVSAMLGLKKEQVKFIQDAALDWMRAAVESKYTLSSVEGPVTDDDDRHGIESFGTLFAYIRRLCNHQTIDRVKPSRNGQEIVAYARTRKLEPGETGYFDGKDATMNLDSVFVGRRAEQAQPRQNVEKQRALSAREAFERLFGEVVAGEETNGDSGFPAWVRLLPESTATRLHSLLLKSVSTAEVRDLLLKAEPGFAEHQKYLEKAVGDCFVKQEKTAEVLRKWIRRFDEGGHVPGRYVTSPYFLRAAENEKLIIPNVRNIITRHFAGSDVPAAERRLIIGGDIQCAPGFRDLFGDVIPLLKKEKLRGIANVPEMFQDKVDVIILGHLSEMLRYEEDERALLWAQSCLKPGGITIVVASDKVLDVPSRAHFRSKFNTAGERILSAARYQEFLAGRGFGVEMGRATLHLESKTPEGLAAMGEMLRFTLPKGVQTQVTKDDTEAYLDQYARDNGGEGVHALNYTLAFLVAHENPNVRFSLATPEPILEAVARRMGGGVGAEELKSLFDVRDWQSRVSEMISANGQEEREVFIPQETVVQRSKQERSHARGDVKDGKEYFKLHWQYLKAIHGKRYGRRTEEEIMELLKDDEAALHAFVNRPIRTQSKKAFSKPARQYNPKVEKRYAAKLQALNDRLIHLREDNQYTVDPKIGEIVINGKRCVKTRYFASIYGIDVASLKEAVQAFGLQPAGYALERDSEDDALAMGRRTAVFELDRLLQIPFVKARVQNDHAQLLTDFSQEKPISARDQRNALLRGLDAEVAAEPALQVAIALASIVETARDACEKIITRWKLYADGSRHQSSKDTQPEQPGAWTYILKDADGTAEEVHTGTALTPNVDRMELMAVVAGLEKIHERFPDLEHEVEIFSDSKYVYQRLVELLPRGQADKFVQQSNVYRSWKARGDVDPANHCDIDLIYALQNILQWMEVTYTKVEKLIAPPEHTRCDTIAVLARRRLAAELGFHTTHYVDQSEAHSS